MPTFCLRLDAALGEDVRPSLLLRTVLSILQARVGRLMAISRDKLLESTRSMPGFGGASDRQLRQCINQLRKDGWPVCSAGGEDGGYWMAANWEELDEYIERELHSRAMDMLAQEKALRASAEKRWGQYSRQFTLQL